MIGYPTKSIDSLKDTFVSGSLLLCTIENDSSMTTNIIMQNIIVIPFILPPIFPYFQIHLYYFPLEKKLILIARLSITTISIFVGQSLFDLVQF